MTRSMSAATAAAALELANRGYVITIQNDSLKVLKKPGANGSLKALVCVGCAHLQAYDLGSRGKLCSCRRGYWRNRRNQAIWYHPTRLFDPPPFLARIVQTCADHEPAEVA